MNGNNSPLEHLAAFAIVFAMGVISTLAMTAYGARKAKPASNIADRRSH
ncbi:hypothetical protein LZ017_05950 [Pelomonas sp. CA6]|nr:hypothetical protein [Pelomonas sp. CA6]MCH7342922.1 hypothetical protein [Pelomonas sp. CA6]